MCGGLLEMEEVTVGALVFEERYWLQRAGSGKKL